MQDNCSQLLNELESQQSKVTSLAASLQSALAAHQSEAERWTITHQQIQVSALRGILLFQSPLVGGKEGCLVLPSL